MALYQINVKNAFLNGDLFEVVYMRPPPVLLLYLGMYAELRRALYGLKRRPALGMSIFLNLYSLLDIHRA